MTVEFQQGGITQAGVDAVYTDLWLVGGLDMADCARVMLETVRNNPIVDRVVFVLFDSQALGVFQKAWHDLSRS